MSVANILFLPGRILCLSDTMIYNSGKPVGLCETKCRIFRTGSFAVVSRGLCDVAAAFEGYLHSHPGVFDIDTAEDALPALMGMAVNIKSTTRPDLRVEMTLMGWSPIRQDLRVIQFGLFKHRPDWDVAVLDRGLHLHPHPGAAVPPPPRNHEDAMVRLALAQDAVLVKRGYKGMCIGGAMHLTTITRDGAEQRIIGLYPGYDEDAARFCDPNAAAVAAFRGRAAA